MFVIDKSKYICDNILYNYCRKEDLSFTYIFTTSAREIEMEVIYEKNNINNYGIGNAGDSRKYN